MLAIDQSYTFRPDVVATVLDDGAVLLDLETKFFYELDASAWALASLFEAGASPDDVLAQSREWGAPERDEPAIRAVVETLVAENLIVPSFDAPSVAAATKPSHWASPVIQKQEKPLQQIMMSAFDPSVPLLE